MQAACIPHPEALPGRAAQGASRPLGARLGLGPALGGALGMVMSLPEMDRLNMFKDECHQRLAMTMAGKAAAWRLLTTMPTAYADFCRSGMRSSGAVT